MSATETNLITQIKRLTLIKESGLLDYKEFGVYASLIVEWNKLRRPEWFGISKSRMMRELNFGSHNTFLKIRDSLRNKGLIQFEDCGRGKMVQFHLNEIEDEKIIQKSHENIGKKTRSKNAIGRSKNDLVDEAHKRATRSKNAIFNSITRSKNDLEIGQKMTQSQRNREKNSEPVSVNSSNTMLTPRDMYINIQGPGIITDADFEKIVQRYEAEIGAPSKGAREALRKAAEEFGADAVEAGISMAVRRNVKNSGFVLGIVKSMAHGGLCGKECLS